MSDLPLGRIPRSLKGIAVPDSHETICREISKHYYPGIFMPPGWQAWNAGLHNGILAHGAFGRNAPEELELDMKTFPGSAWSRKACFTHRREAGMRKAIKIIRAHYEKE